MNQSIILQLLKDQNDLTEQVEVNIFDLLLFSFFFHLIFVGMFIHYLYLHIAFWVQFGIQIPHRPTQHQLHYHECKILVYSIFVYLYHTFLISHHLQHSDFDLILHFESILSGNAVILPEIVHFECVLLSVGINFLNEIDFGCESLAYQWKQSDIEYFKQMLCEICGEKALLW